MTTKKNKKPNFEIIEDLKNSSLDSFKQKHYLQSAIIIFQTVENLLRIAIRGFGKGHGISDDSLKKAADEEISFYRLVLHFDLINPENGLSKRLLKFNKERNRIMHSLFVDYESMTDLEESLQEFCMDGIKLNQDIRKLLGITD